MSESLKILLTASATLIGGLFLFALTKIVVEPIQELRKIIGKIGHHVFLSRGLIENTIIDNNTVAETIAELEKVTENFQELSASLRSAVNTIPTLWLWRFFFGLPKKRSLLEAASHLSVISYFKHEHDKSKVSQEIDKLFELLRLEMYWDNK